MSSVKDAQDNDTYKKIGKQVDDSFGTVSGECQTNSINKRNSRMISLQPQQ